MNMNDVQVRTLPERRGYGLLDPGEQDGPLDKRRPARWVGKHSEVLTPYAAVAYPSADEARQALRAMVRGDKK